MFCLVFLVCCVGKGLCGGLITRSEETYRVCEGVSNCLWSRNLNMRWSEGEKISCATEKKMQQIMCKGVPVVQDVTSYSVANLP
jgi:hypothetical protein